MARTFGATLVVLLTIVITMLLVRTLSLAASDIVEPKDVVLVLGYTTLGHLATILSLSLFVRRRRIWVRVDPVAGSDGTDSLALLRVQVAGLTRSDSADVSGEVEQLVTRLGGPVDVEEGT